MRPLKAGGAPAPALAAMLLAAAAAAAALALAAAPPAAAAPADAGGGVAPPESPAQDQALTITTSKQVYYYGDRLSFTVGAPGYGGEGGSVAYLYIAHENGRTSSPVPIPLTGRQTVSTSPAAFQPPPKQYPDLPYPTGLYTLRIEYDGAAAEASFSLQDSGRIVIPSWIKDTTRLWTADKIGDSTYAMSIGYLIANGIIDVGGENGGGSGAGGAGADGAGGGASIPAWVKQSAQWWIDGMIGDGEYGASLQYLLRAGVIVV